MEKKKMKIWKKVLIIILILALIFIIITARKMIIIKDLQDKVSKYTSLDNYYAKIYSYQGNYLSKCETYKNKEKSLTEFSNISNSGIRNLKNYNNGEKTNTYIQSNNDRIAILNSNNIPSPIEIHNWLYTENIWNLIAMSIKTSIQSEECNGKKCYKINESWSSNFIYNESQRQNQMYIDKETGLLVRRYDGTMTLEDGEVTNIVVDYNYEFGNVRDEDIIEPDITQYKIQENN